MKKILIPTDFSSCADSATRLAIELASKMSVDVEILHLISTPIDWVKLPLEKEKLYPETKAQINKAKEELKKRIKWAKGKGVNAKSSLLFNQGPIDLLAGVADDNTLLVLGSHGDAGLHEMLIGSNAQHVIRKSRNPVVIVKHEVGKAVQNIVFVSDFQDVSKDSFTQVTSFADMQGAAIDLLFVNTPDGFRDTATTEANMDSVLLHCDRAEKCTKNVVNASSVEEGVREFISQKEVDLVAICTHGRSGIAQIFSPSIAESLANHLDLPLLSIKL